MAREHRSIDMSAELTTALNDALTAGGVTVAVGRIDGHGGYYNPAQRSVHLNPDAPADVVAGTLLDALRAMRPERPKLRLIHGGG